MNIKYNYTNFGTFSALRFYPVFSKLFPILYRCPETIPVFSPIKSQSLRNFSGGVILVLISLYYSTNLPPLSV